jgi:hypothetical protein
MVASTSDVIRRRLANRDDSARSMLANGAARWLATIVDDADSLER